MAMTIKPPNVDPTVDPTNSNSPTLVLPHQDALYPYCADCDSYCCAHVAALLLDEEDIIPASAGILVVPVVGKYYAQVSISKGAALELMVQNMYKPSEKVYIGPVSSQDRRLAFSFLSISWLVNEVQERNLLIANCGSADHRFLDTTNFEDLKKKYNLSLESDDDLLVEYLWPMAYYRVCYYCFDRALRTPGVQGFAENFGIE